MLSGRCPRPSGQGEPEVDPPQPAMPGQLRAVTNWVGPVGTGARLANALRQWSVLRFEVTEDPSPGALTASGSATPRSWGCGAEP